MIDEITQHYQNNKVLHINSANKMPKFVSARIFSDFFAQLSPKAQELYPLDMSDEGYKTSYFSAVRSSEQAGFVEKLDIVTEFSDQTDSYLMETSFSFDDEQLFVHIDSLYHTKGDSHSDFAGKMLKKMYSFIKKQDETRDDAKQYPSEISIHAYSDEENTAGGYIWAKHNFLFENVEEKTAAFLAFKKFCRQNKISATIFAKPNKPADYAAMKTPLQSNNMPVGKAFLLQYSWRGKITSQEPLDKEKSKSPFKMLAEKLHSR